MTTDRRNRDRIAAAIDDYLDERISSDAFVDAVNEAAWESSDPTVKEFRNLLWGLCDDILDHKVVLSQEEWDYVQRLLLLLRSDARLETTTRRIWTARQALAALGLTIFGFAVVWLGWNLDLIRVTIPLGIAAILLLRWRSRSTVPSRRWIALTPFASVTELLQVRRHVRDFVKHQYPSRLKGKRLRSAFRERLMMFYSNLLLVLASPLALLCLALPEKEYDTHVFPGQSDA
jgi:hypothetical protein